MGLHHRSLVVVAMVLSIIMSTNSMVRNGMSASEQEKDECTEQLVGLATCIPYVGGNAKAPTPDCCNGLKQVLKNNKKCLCVIIKDRNDPDLGLNINVTLALGLPSVCQAPANVSQCPALLHLPPNSPDAQVFYQFAKNSSSHDAVSPAPSPTAGGNGQGPSAQQKSSGCCRAGKKHMTIIIGILLCSLVGYLHLFI